MHPLASLAMKSVTHFLEKEEPLPCPDPLPEVLKASGGIFVSIKKNGVLRGCIGTLSPNHENLAKEVIHNAIKAANKDPRFPPIEKEELSQLSFSVDVLTPAEKINDLGLQDVTRFGLIVRFKEKKGLLLPDLENIKTAEQQLKICLKKGKINESDPYTMSRFEVKRFG